MTAAETIEAAIKKLEGLAEDSTGDGWQIGGAYSPWLVTDACRCSVAETMDDCDAELIVTLHHTIDAQLKLFESALWLMKGDALAYTHAATAGVIRLAEAILGKGLNA